MALGPILNFAACNDPYGLFCKLGQRHMPAVTLLNMVCSLHCELLQKSWQQLLCICQGLGGFVSCGNLLTDSQPVATSRDKLTAAQA